MKKLDWTNCVALTPNTSYTCPKDGYILIVCFNANTSFNYETKINNFIVCGGYARGEGEMAYTWGTGNSNCCQLEVNQGCIITGTFKAATFVPYK